MTWELTNELRWLEKEVLSNVPSIGGSAVNIKKYKTTTLQQKWVRNTGEIEWRDVPTVKEEK